MLYWIMFHGGHTSGKAKVINIFQWASQAGCFLCCLRPLWKGRLIAAPVNQSEMVKLAQHAHGTVFPEARCELKERKTTTEKLPMRQDNLIVICASLFFSPMPFSLSPLSLYLSLLPSSVHSFDRPTEINCPKNTYVAMLCRQWRFALEKSTTEAHNLSQYFTCYWNCFH